MSIQFGNRKQGHQGTSVRVGDGVYVDHGTIKQVQAHYNVPPKDGWNPDDVVLTLGLEVEGLDWQKELKLWGNFRREPSGQGTEIIAGPGSAFKVLRVFDELGIQGEVTPTGQIPQDCIDQLYGHTIFFLQYAAYRKDSGKVGYEDYQIVAAQWDDETEEETRQRLYSQFQQDEYVTANRYRPDLLSTDAQGDGATTATPSGVGSDVNTPMQPDDDVPF